MFKACESFRIVGDVSRDNLHGDVALQTTVVGAIHLAHAAGTNGRPDFVWTEAGAGLERQGAKYTAALLIVFVA